MAPLNITEQSPLFAIILRDELAEWSARHGLDASDARVDVAVLRGLDLYKSGRTLDSCLRIAQEELLAH